MDKKPDVGGFVERLLKEWREHDWMDIDGGDLHEMVVSFGLYYERPITEDEAASYWFSEYGLVAGDIGTFPSPELDAAIAKAREAQ